MRIEVARETLRWLEVLFLDTEIVRAVDAIIGFTNINSDSCIRRIRRIDLYISDNIICVEGGICIEGGICVEVVGVGSLGLF